MTRVYHILFSGYNALVSLMTIVATYAAEENKQKKKWND